MAIYIKHDRTEMPKGCRVCNLCINDRMKMNEFDYCLMTRTDVDFYRDTRPSDCPLVDIPDKDIITGKTCETCFHSTIDDDGDEVYCEKYCFVADSCDFRCSGWRAKND